jgi:hypothetical protein
MPRLFSSFALVTLSVLAACGGSTEAAKGAGDAAMKPADKPAEPAKKPEGVAKKPAEGAPDAKNEPASGPDEPRKVDAFVGDDPGVSVKLVGPKAWTLGEGESWEIGLYTYTRTEGSKNFFRVFAGEEEFSVPGAFTRDAKVTPGLKKGDPVRVNVVTNAVCGLVVSASDQKVKVMFDWGSQIDTREVEPYEVLALDGKLSYGAPVLYKEQGEEGWQAGSLVYMNAKTAWLQGNIKADPKLVKPVDVMKKYKKGDKVLAYPMNTITVYRPGKITKVLEDGLFYEYEVEDGRTETADYCHVTSPIK